MYNVEIPKTPVSTQDFFRNLSDEWEYNNKEFEIQQNFFGNGAGFQILESSKPWKFNPIRFFIKPTPETTHVATAENLASLINQEDMRKAIFKDPECNVEQITKTLTDIQNRIVADPLTQNGSRIQSGFDRAIKTLNQTYEKYLSNFYGSGRDAGFHKENAVDPKEFYEKLSHTFWPIRFHERFQVIEPKAGEFEVHYIKRPWFFQRDPLSHPFIDNSPFKSYGPIPAAAKISTAEKLVKMIAQDKKLIRVMQVNVSGMITNLERIKGKITRNTTKEETKKIEDSFDEAIKELNKIHQLIKKDVANSWTTKIWKHVIIPVPRFMFQKGIAFAVLIGRGIKAGFDQMKHSNI